MAGEGMVVKMDGESSKLNNELGKAAKKTKEVEDAVEGVTKESKKADATLRKFAKRMTELNATPQEKMARKQAQLNAALKKGLITQQTYNREIAQMARHQAKIRATQFKGAMGSFGMGALAGGGIAGGVMGAAAIGKQLGQQTLAQAAEWRGSAIEAWKSREIGEQELMQVSKSLSDFKSLRAKRNRLAGMGVDIADAGRVVFSGRSEGFDDRATMDEIGRFSQIGRVDTASVLAGRTRGLFGDGAKISARGVLNQGLVAAETSVLDVNQLAAVMPRAAEGMGRTGAGISEGFAALSVMSKNFSSAQTTADRIKALAGKQAMSEHKDLTFVDFVKKLQSMPEGERRDILKDDQESNAAFAVASKNIVQIEALSKKLAAAGQDTGYGSFIAQKYRIAEGDEVTQRRRALKIEENLANEALATYGQDAAKNEIALKQTQKDMARLGLSPAAAGWGKWTSEQAAYMGLDEGAVRGSGLGMSGGLRGAWNYATENPLTMSGRGLMRAFSEWGVEAVQQAEQADAMAQAANSLQSAAANLEQATSGDRLKNLAGGAEADAKRMQSGANN